MTRIPTDIPTLDRMLNGGFIPESAILLRGAPGTGKTTLGFQYLIQGIQRGEKGIFISFEEFPASLYRDAASFGWDLKALEKSGHFQILFTSPQVFLAGLESPDSPVNRALAGKQRAVFDSLTHFTRITRDSLELRRVYQQVIRGLRREGLTSIFLGEETAADFTSQERGRLAFLVDCIIMLRYLEIDSQIQRAIVVLKMRASDHDKAIHSYQLGPNGLHVEGPLEGKIGLLSAIAQHSIISSVDA